ncbi:hypothetical protein JW964_24065 [candidate division KSB1 bacterium]|nr:hypothetical protein [candidate division KSB1 bacterium]
MKDQISQIIQAKKNDHWWIESEKKVLDRYGSLFNLQNIKNLTKEEFQSFLLIKNNYHREGIHLSFAARYPAYKAKMAKIATKEVSTHYLKQTKELFQWLSNLMK